MLAANLGSLAHLVQVHSEAGALQFVAKLQESLQALREVAFLLKQKGICAENCTEVLLCVKRFLRGFEVKYQSEES